MTYYVVGSLGRYLLDDEWFGTLDEAMKFESLSQALEFLDSSGLELNVYRIEILEVFNPNLNR